MRKLSLLLGTLGGAMAGYVFSNKKLRDELSSAKDAEAAGKILAKHLKTDGKQVGKEIQELVKSEEVQSKLSDAKKYVKTNVQKAKEDLKSMMKREKEKEKKAAPAKPAPGTKKMPVKKTDTVA